MRQLSTTGQKMLASLAERHGFSPEAILNMMEAVINGNGGMAQFNHPEFAGAGQWMRGGMTMLSDMFNSQLKGRVDRLCSELSSLIAAQPELGRIGSFQTQSQGSEPRAQTQDPQGSWKQHRINQAAEGSSLFVSEPVHNSAPWWPADLGEPNSVGAQNDIRYAYFAQSHRLAIESGGKLKLYDTLDHQISGISQHQSQGGSVIFTSQYGQVDLTRLPLISVGDVSAEPKAQEPLPSQDQQGDIFTMIERLAGLRAKGILTEEEFSTKKAELLNRL